MSIGIKGKWVIAYDGAEHRLLRDGIVVTEGNRIKHVGKSYQGDVDRWIDASHHVVIPGMICTHTHASTAPKDKSFIDDTGARHFYMSSLGENLTALGKSIRPEDHHVFARYSMAELLRSGCTTMLEIGMVGSLGAEATVRHIGELGIRAVEGCNVEDGRWARSQGANLETEWLGLEHGMRLLDEAERFVKRYDGALGGRLIAALYPSTVDKVSGPLQKEVRVKADELGCPVTIHAAQWVVEFQNMLRMYRRTPIEYLGDTGLLGPDLIIGHGWAVAGHPLLAYPPAGGGDLELLARSGATVSHDPFAKRGNKMHSHSGYLAAGINVSIGCDTSPQDMLNEMRMASYMSKVADWSCFSGAETLNNVPCRDPVKNLVNSATREDVDYVVVDGVVVVDEGVLLTVDEEKLVSQVQTTTETIWDRIPENHYLGKTSDEVSPQSFKPWRQPSA